MPNGGRFDLDMCSAVEAAFADTVGFEELTLDHPIAARGELGKRAFLQGVFDRVRTYRTEITDSPFGG